MSSIEDRISKLEQRMDGAEKQRPVKVLICPTDAELEEAKASGKPFIHATVQDCRKQP